MKRLLAHLVALVAWTAVADALNTYTFKEPSGGDVAIYWDGKKTTGAAFTGFGWTGGDPSDRWYPQPKENADIIFDDSQRSTKSAGFWDTIYIYGYGGVTYPLIFNSVGQTGSSEKAGGVYLSGRSTDVFTVGAGGMSFYFPLTFANDFTVKLAESQPFYVTKANYTFDNATDFGSSLTAGESTTWTVGGKFRLRFTGGSSSNFHGSVVANNAFHFYGTNQHQRLAGKKITLTTDAINSLDGSPQLVWNFQKTDARTSVTTPIELDLRRNTWIASKTSGITVTGSDHLFPWIAMASADAETDMELRFDAPVTGVVTNRSLILGESTAQSYASVIRVNYAGLARSDQQRMVFAADNSGLLALGPRNSYVSSYYYYEGWRTLNYTDPGHVVFVTTILQLAHKNAFGANNSEFNFEFRYGGDLTYGGLHVGQQATYQDSEWWHTMFYGTDGYKRRVIMGVVSTNGVYVGSNFYMQSNMFSGGSDLYAHSPILLFGTDGPGESVFGGKIAHAPGWGGGNYRNSPGVRLQGGEGGSAVFTNAMSFGSSKVVIGKGDVVFTNPNTAFSASNDPYGMRVRAGRFIITDKNAVRHTGTPQQEVLLGDWVPSKHEVRVYNARKWTKAEVGGSDPKYYSDYQHGYTNNLLEFVTMPTIDGVTLEVGDLVLQSNIGVALEGYSSYYTTGSTKDETIIRNWVIDRAPNCAFINGVWEVIDAKHWRRVEWLDQDDEVCAGYGIRIHVREGAKHGGKTFYLANHEDWTYEKLNDPGSAPDGTGKQKKKIRSDTGFHFGPCYYWNGTGNYGWISWSMPFLAFHDEPSYEPNASFLLKGTFDYAGKVVVTDNKSSGDSEIGGLAEGVTNRFTGIVRVEKSAVCLTSATNSLVMFTTLSNAVGVASTIVKTGAGTVALTNANLKLTMDGGLTLRAGTLVVSTNFYGLRGGVGQPPISYQLVNRASGTLEVAAGAGEVDLVTGRTFNLSNFENLRLDRDVANLEVVLLRNTDGGELIGTPTVTGLGDDTYWRIHLRKNELVASYVKRGTFIIVR